MELLRERFLKTYANVPLNLRDDIILVLEDTDDIKKPLSWNVAYLEVRVNGPRSQNILESLAKLELILLRSSLSFYELSKSDDPLAAFFLDPAFAVLESLIEGKNAQEAFDGSQKVARDNLSMLVASSNSNYNTAAASLLYHNLTHQVLLGDGARAA